MPSETPLLSETQVAFFVIERSGWSVVDGALRKTFELPTFAEAVTFVNEVAFVAEQAGHHPDIDIRYNQVTLTLTTHDAGGVTGEDTHLAGLIEDVIAQESLGELTGP